MANIKAFVLAVFVLPFVAMGSTTWYVNARWGSNGYSGLSSFQPKQSIQATIKEAVMKGVLDPEDGAEVKLDPTNPSITTAKTIPGLTYLFHESTALETLPGKTPVTHPGDGMSWKPTITVKDGECGFYSIGVTK